MHLDAIGLYAGHLQQLLAAGPLDDLGEVALTPDRVWDAETAVRMVLAEHQHLMSVLDRGQWVQQTRWRQLHDQLEQLYRLAEASPSRTKAMRAFGPGRFLQLLSGSPDGHHGEPRRRTRRTGAAVG